MVQNIGNVLIAIILIFAPSAGMFLLGVTNDSKTLMVLALAWLVVSVTGSFAVKVWRKLEDPAVDKVAAEISRRVGELWGNYRHKYVQHLIYRHRAFDVKGLSTQGIYTLELNQVFVELSIAPQAPHLASADPLRALPEHLRQGGHVIWEYLRAEPLRAQNLVVIGPPGSGKTTLLKNITLTLAAATPQRRAVNAPDKLPVLLFLRDHAAAITGNPAFSLVDAVQQTLQKWQMAAAPGWFERQLAAGSCLVMLDGLDEVADPAARQQVVNWVDCQMETHYRNRFIITSRPHGYRNNPLRTVTALAVQPFSQSQVQRFVQNWYRAIEIMSAQKDDPGVHMAAHDGAEDLLRRLHGAPALMDMAVNPLLLTMIATVHRYRSSLPGRRVELYAEICEVFLGKRQQAKGLALDLTPAQKQRVLQPLAYYMMAHNLREIERDQAQRVLAEPLQLVNPNYHPADFLPLIERSSGLLLERESGRYGFAHLTFQEFLAAVHAQEQGLEAALTGHVADGWWHETLRLYSARADATPVLQACLAATPPTVAALTLALECLAEAREVAAAVRANLEAVLETWVEDSAPERRRLAAETLLALRLRRLRRLDDNTYIDDSLLTCAEYQLFLDERRDQGEYYQPDHWTTLSFAAGQGKTPLAGARPADAVAFCAWLTARQPGGWRYRLPYPGEAGEKLGNGRVGYWAEPPAGPLVLVGATAPANTMETINHWVALDIDLDLVRTRISDLTRIRDTILDLVHNLIRELIHDYNLDHDLDLTLASDLVYDGARGYDQDRDRPFAIALALVRTHDLVRERARDLARAHNLIHNLALDNALDFDRILELDHAHNRAFDHTYELIRDRKPPALLANVQSSGADWIEIAALVRWYIRLLALLAAVDLEEYMPAEPPLLARLAGSNKIRARREEIQKSVAAYMGLYADLAILEARIAGKLPAFEGIRLVKERASEPTA